MLVAKEIQNEDFLPLSGNSHRDFYFLRNTREYFFFNQVCRDSKGEFIRVPSDIAVRLSLLPNDLIDAVFESLEQDSGSSNREDGIKKAMENLYGGFLSHKSLGEPYASAPPSNNTVDYRFIDDTFERLQYEELETSIKEHYVKALTEGSAGLDLRYIGKEPLVLKPGEEVKIHTGLSIWLKDKNLVGKIYPRSSLGGNEGIVLGNLTGIIDSDYQGELIVCLYKRPRFNEGELIKDDVYMIQPGERIAQYVIEYRPSVTFNQVIRFEETTERGSGGFGSTGRI